MFFDGTITGEPEVTTYLGRPWRAYAQTSFIRTEMGAVVMPQGWDYWRNPDREKTARYAEYHNTGPGADSSQRVAWARQLPDGEAEQLTPSRILRGEDAWQIPPSLAP